MMSRQVIFKPQALGHLRWLSVREQRMVTDGIRQHLVDNDPRIETRNKFRLHRTSEVADYELRLDHLRVLYRAEETDVLITVIGRKRGNALIVEGREYVL